MRKDWPVNKQAAKMMRLSCHRFRSNEVRLWLSVMAYNLGNLWRRLALPKRIDNLVADQFAATVGEDRRSSDQARAVLLTATGGEPPDGAAVRKHAAADRGVGRASGVAIDSCSGEPGEEGGRGRGVWATSRKAGSSGFRCPRKGQNGRL